MHRKKILLLLLSTLFLFSCGRKSKASNINPDKPQIKQLEKQKKNAWWKFGSKKN